MFTICVIERPVFKHDAQVEQNMPKAVAALTQTEMKM